MNNAKQFTNGKLEILKSNRKYDKLRIIKVIENGEIEALINKKLQMIRSNKVEGRKPDYFGAEYDSYRASTGYRGEEDNNVNMLCPRNT